MKKIFVFFILLIFVDCKTGFHKKENVYLSNQIAIYLYNQEDYPEDKEIKAHLKDIQKFPENSYEKLISLFENLKIEKKTFFSREIYPLFYPEQIYELSKVLKDVIINLPDRKRILIVQKYDPFKTVMSKNKRTTFLLWYDDDGYNLVFGTVHEDLLPDLFLSEEKDWLDIYPISLKRSEPNQQKVKEDYFDYKKIGDFTHYTWLIVKPENIQNLPIAKKKLPGDDKKISERLEKLKELYEKKLINESEYIKKRSEILSEL